ncbi:hypothetical protein BRCON_0205 [Candidatus Sumerlaea chitinivorans]|uniref:Uncharacterized protein n=1 Tax=Sumerlaea chitinivorans TaxID=2250252 RepID=A0A2Z4Y2L7_SUMC1|nr:hypothetical protein BRCON_0205 [Candidatus Sumerlaea chitinivorans]
MGRLGSHFILSSKVLTTHEQICLVEEMGLPIRRGVITYRMRNPRRQGGPIPMAFHNSSILRL